MRIVEIKALSNGGHRNQTIDGTIKIPEGWAVVPDEMETPNFPVGDVEVEEIDGVMTVKKWVDGTIPERKESERPVSEVERLRADIDFVAAMTGEEL